MLAAKLRHPGLPKERESVRERVRDLARSIHSRFASRKGAVREAQVPKRQPEVGTACHIGVETERVVNADWAGNVTRVNLWFNPESFLKSGARECKLSELLKGGAVQKASHHQLFRVT